MASRRSEPSFCSRLPPRCFLIICLRNYYAKNDLGTMHVHPFCGSFEANEAIRRSFLHLFCCFLIQAQLQSAPHVRDLNLQKGERVIIYKDDKFYSSFPSIVCRPDGQLIVAFRRAPERRVFGEPSTTHTD